MPNQRKKIGEFNLQANFNAFFSYRFLQLIGQIMSLRDAKTLVFCQTKRRVDEIYRLTKQMGFPVVS